MLDCAWLFLEGPAQAPTQLRGPAFADGLHPSPEGYSDIERACWGPALQFLRQLPPRGEPAGPTNLTYYSDLPRRADSGVVAMMTAWLRGQNAGRRLR